MYLSSDQPKASRISAYAQCVNRITSNRPARLSVSPRWMRSGADPRMRTFSRIREAVSSSQSLFTDSDQSGIFCTSSMTRTLPSFPASRASARAAPHCCWSHTRPCDAGSSAEMNLTGLSQAAATCCASVVFPVWRGPARTWMKRLFSCNLAFRTRNCSRL